MFDKKVSKLTLKKLILFEVLMNRFVPIILASMVLVSCSSRPKVPTAELPKSTLDTPANKDDGTAVAFQLKTKGCDSGRFTFAPKLADGKYGDPISMDYGRSVFNLSLAKDNVNKMFVDAGRKDKLFARLIPAGTYTAIRPTCSRGSDSSTRVRYSTNPSLLMGFFDFKVEAGKTNYIGEIEVNGRSRGLSLNIADKFNGVESEFMNEYSDEPVGPIKKSLAERTLKVIAIAKE